MVKLRVAYKCNQETSLQNQVIQSTPLFNPFLMNCLWVSLDQSQFHLFNNSLLRSMLKLLCCTWCLSHTLLGTGSVSVYEYFCCHRFHCVTTEMGWKPGNGGRYHKHCNVSMNTSQGGIDELWLFVLGKIG